MLLTPQQARAAHTVLRECPEVSHVIFKLCNGGLLKVRSLAETIRAWNSAGTVLEEFHSLGAFAAAYGLQ